MNIYFFGDSICFGQFVSPHKTWINKLALHLETCFGDKILIQNPSVNGRTSRQGLEDMQYQILSHAIDALYVQFGMNDCNHWASENDCARVSQQAFFENLKEIVFKARKSGIKLIFLGTNHPTPRTNKFNNLNFSYQHMNEEYNKLIREAAKIMDVILVDHEEHWFSILDTNNILNQLVLADGIHLSSIGHKLYAEFASQIFTIAVKNLNSIDAIAI